MLARWPIRNKMLVGLALVLVIVGVLSISGFRGSYAYRELVRIVSWRVSELPLASDISQRANELRLALSDTRVLRSLPRSSDGSPPASVQAVRTDFYLKRLALEEAIAAYRVQLADDQERDIGIGDKSQEWETLDQISDSVERVTEIERAGLWVLDQDAADSLSSELQHLQSLAMQLPSYLHHDLADFKFDARRQYRTLIVLTYISSILALTLLVVFFHLFYRWVFRPLRILIKGSRKVAGGQFQHRIKLATNDEMSELAEAMNDMTERFQTIHDDLNRQVKERTKQVVRSEQMASVGFLAAGVAHEINNPLASIALCAESLESRMCEALPPDHPDAQVVQHYLRMIQDEAFRCKEITERLLDFSRMGEVKRQSTELRDLVQGVIDMVGHLGKYHNKQVELLPGEPVIAAVNSQEIKQVVLNLLTNGLDSVGSEGRVSVEISAVDKQAELIVTDNGCGMTAEVLEHLFEPFFTRKEVGQGTGLGLSITYRIIEDHGGEIDVTSAGPGTGSRFRVRLPLAVQREEQRHRYQAA